MKLEVLFDAFKEQFNLGELTVGDSHEYGLVHDPFDKNGVNQLILDYLQQFTLLKNQRIVQTWSGIYPKRLRGNMHFIYQAEQGVIIFNGLGGVGITLSFGLAEQVVEMAE